MKTNEDIHPKEKKVWNILLFLTIIEGIGAEILLLSIERDTKNIQFLGLSYSRLLLIGVILFLLIVFVYLLFNKSVRNWIVNTIHKSSTSIEILKWVCVFLIFFLWYVLWIPASRFETKAATFIRLQPFLVWIGLIGTQFYLLIKIIKDQLNVQRFIQSVKENRKIILFTFILVFLSGFLLYILASFPVNYASGSLFFPPGAPLSGMQVFSCWTIFLFILLVENTKGANLVNNKKLGILTFIAIWAVTIFFWTSTSLPCTDDRPGPFPPNYLCYPQAFDAMYSIGTHYLALGQGISHQDKPLYAIFLVLGQWIFGPTIDRYLLFQVIILALIPALLFLLGKRMMGYAGGLFLAVLALIQETYAIGLYEKIGSVNVKMESPELFTAFLLIILCIALFNWLKFPDQKMGAIFTGGVLGLAIMARFNAVMIVPVIMLVFLIATRKNRKVMMVGLGLFVLLVGISSLPGFLSQGTSGGNFIIGKINSVINSRFVSDKQSQPPSTTSTPKATVTSINQDNSVSVEKVVTPSADAYINNYAAPTTAPEVNDSISMAAHFLNNYFSSLVRLPTEVLFESIHVQVDGNLWNFKTAEPIWHQKMTIQNALALMLNLMIIVLGILWSYKHFRLAGLSPLIIQFGYFIGNAVTMTSGGRYLEPVIWVTLIYYVIGLYILASINLRFLGKEVQLSSDYSIYKPTHKMTISANKNGIFIYAIIGFLILGMLAPLSAFIPDQLPEQSGEQTNQTAFQYLAENSSLTEAQWQLFLSDPESLVVEGIAYHPRYYRSGYFPTGNPRFEIMVLGKENTFIGYHQISSAPKDYFSDGSRVILVGCKIYDKNEWYAHLAIMNVYAIIQMDHEQSIYMDNELPICSEPE